MHIKEVSAKPIKAFLDLPSVAIVSSCHGLGRLANVLDVAGLAGYQVDYPGGLAVVVSADGILPASVCTPDCGSTISHPSTADTGSVYVQPVATWRAGIWCWTCGGLPVLGLQGKAGNTGWLSGHNWYSWAQFLQLRVLMQGTH